MKFSMKNSSPFLPVIWWVNSSLDKEDVAHNIRNYDRKFVDEWVDITIDELHTDTGGSYTFDKHILTWLWKSFFAYTQWIDVASKEQLLRCLDKENISLYFRDIYIQIENRYQESISALANAISKERYTHEWKNNEKYISDVFALWNVYPLPYIAAWTLEKKHLYSCWRSIVDTHLAEFVSVMIDSVYSIFGKEKINERLVPVYKKHGEDTTKVNILKTIFTQAKKIPISPMATMWDFETPNMSLYIGK